MRDGGTGESSEGAVASGQGSKNLNRKQRKQKGASQSGIISPLFSNKISFFFFGKFHFFLLVFFCFLCHWQCRRLRNTLTFPSPFFLPYSACLVKETKNEWKQGDIRPKIKRMKLSSFAFLPPVGSKGRA